MLQYILLHTPIIEKHTNTYKITKMHTHEINENLWNAGIYLGQADRSFAPENLRKAWEEVSKRSALKEANAKLEELKNTQTDLMAAMGALVTTANNVNQAKDDLLGKMRERVVSWLLRGDLVAFGYEKPRQMASRPHHLPPQLWNGHIDWFGSSLKSQGLELMEIRILTKSKIKVIAPEWLSTTENQERALQSANCSTEMPQITAGIKGRTTIKRYVGEAFDALLADGLIKTSKPAKANYSLVRNWLKENRPEVGADDRKPSDEGIRAHFSPLFNNLKENSKQ